MSSPSAPTALAQACDRLAASWEQDARARRKLTPRDLAADTLDYCAAALRQQVAAVVDDDVELSGPEWAALHQVPDSTMRRWCASGAVRARRKGRGWLIRRGERPPAFGREHEAAVASAPSLDTAA